MLHYILIIKLEITQKMSHFKCSGVYIYVFYRKIELRKNHKIKTMT
jgi:hypothetical protein